MIQRKGPEGKLYQFQDGTSEQEMIDAFSSIYNKPESTLSEQVAHAQTSQAEKM